MKEFLFVIPLILYCLSGICDAVIDTLQFHYSKSIFTKYNEQWWNPAISWTNKYIDHDVNKGLRKITILGFITIDYPVQLTDAYHFFKMWREVFNTASITSALIVGTYFTSIEWYVAIAFFGIIGIARNNSFSLFFNKLLIK